MDAMGTDDDYDRPSREPVHIPPGEKENHRERCLGRGILVPRKALSSLYIIVMFNSYYDGFRPERWRANLQVSKVIRPDIPET